MCFSAEASFTVGSVLGAIGIATIKRIKRNSLTLIALIPLIFALQQLTEGVVWLHMDEKLTITPLSYAAQYFFILFAWIIWPLYIPIALMIPEQIRWKRWVCKLAFLVGLAIAYYDLKYLVYEDVVATVVGNSIFYGTTPMYGNIYYGFAILAPIFISSIKNMWIFGVGLFISFILSQMIYAYTFTSVFCFFAAAVSLILLKVLSEHEPYPK